MPAGGVGAGKVGVVFEVGNKEYAQ